MQQFHICICRNNYQPFDLNEWKHTGEIPNLCSKKRRKTDRVGNLGNCTHRIPPRIGSVFFFSGRWAESLRVLSYSRALIFLNISPRTFKCVSSCLPTQETQPTKLPPKEDRWVWRRHHETWVFGL